MNKNNLGSEEKLLSKNRLSCVHFLKFFNLQLKMIARSKY